MDLYHQIDHKLQDILQSILGEKFEVWLTGTINPDFYEGHKNLGKMGGLELIITLKDYNPHPSEENLKIYEEKMREIYGRI